MGKGKWDMESVRAVAARGLVVKMSDGGSVDFTMHDPKDPTYQGHEVAAPAPNKFRNIITEIDGIKFRSKLEGNRYLQLKMMLNAGLIHEFKKQVPFDLRVNGVHITRYIADFVVRYPDGRIVVEDTKGVETEAFKIKKNLMLATMGIEIQLIRNINNNGNNKKSKSRRTRRH